MRQFAALLTRERIAAAASAAGVALGRGPLNLVVLAWLAVAAAYHRGRGFAGVLTVALKLLGDAAGPPPPPARRKARGRPKGKSKGKGGSRRRPEPRSKHDPRGAGGAASPASEEAFVQARRRVPDGFWVALFAVLGAAFERDHAPLSRRHGLRLLALDGTCLNLPAWQRLADHFGTAANGGTKGATGQGEGKGKGKAAAAAASGRRTTQARMVMLQLPLVRLPVAHELVPLAEGERTVAARLLRHVGRGDLVLMDKGFWSYGLFHQVHEQRGLFAIRLMAGVRLRTTKRLGHKDRLVAWAPSDRQWRHLPRSMTLRVIDYQVPGFRPSAIVTNQVDPDRLSRDRWLGLGAGDAAGPRMGGGLYHQRWQIETTFNELKVAQGMEGGLRGRTPAAVHFEVAGHVLLYLLTRWLMVEAAAAHGVADPRRLSFTHASRELRDMAQTLLTAGPGRVRRVLLPLLLARIADHRVPERPGRHYPRPNDTKVRNKGRGKRQLPSKLSAKA